jgi:hypothetical protein
MDASSFMETAAQRRRPAAPPPPPRRKRQRISPNAALISGVGTLLLALGIGVLIGRSGNQGTAPTAAAPPILTVPAGGGKATTSTSPGTGTGGSKTTKSGGGGSAKAKAAGKTGSNGQSEAAEEVLKPTGDVKLPPPEVTVGGECPKGTAGCDNGKFEGNFFGE